MSRLSSSILLRFASGSSSSSSLGGASNSRLGGFGRPLAGSVLFPFFAKCAASAASSSARRSRFSGSAAPP